MYRVILKALHLSGQIIYPSKGLAILQVSSGRELQDVFSTPYPLRYYNSTEGMGTRSRTINKICLASIYLKRQLGFFRWWNSPSHPAKPAGLFTF